MHVIVCTSRRPSPRTRTFCRDLASSSCIFQYYTRGKSNMISIMSQARISGAQRVWVVSSSHRNPKSITFYDVWATPPTRIGSIVIRGVTLRREIKNLYPESTKARPLLLIPPTDNSLMDLYSLIKNSLPQPQPYEVPCTQLRISRSPSNEVEILFEESQTGLLCGPKISLGEYRWRVLA